MSQERDRENEKNRLERFEKEKSHPLYKFPKGTLFTHRKKIYCLQQGLDGIILVDVNDGTWQFITEISTKKTFHQINQIKG